VEGVGIGGAGTTLGSACTLKLESHANPDPVDEFSYNLLRLSVYRIDFIVKHRETGGGLLKVLQAA
jgi:hypothetical protein